MTDSMKFGPEWLRNMSSDGSIGGIGAGNNSNGGSGGGGLMMMNNNNNINSNMNLGGGTLAASGTAPIGPRYPLAEFRYGREELLSLFDKNCKKPEVLSTYRRLYIDKVQCPLALTPSTDEEGPTAAPQTVQRPWMLRSPVGGTQRVSGRCGSADRGRVRPRGAFHTMFQRPTPMYEDEIRGMKSERGWPERNGTDAPPPEWNGSPSSSPRREFSSHARNLENWRKGRTDEEAIMSPDGWRSGGGPGSGSGSNGGAPGNYRWSRSTSWRDEEGSLPMSGDGGPTPMQRSFSTISTTASANALSKSASADNTSKSGWDPEDLLPEWAIENPTDTGGTFDASGAFHGSNDEDDESKSQLQRSRGRRAASPVKEPEEPEPVPEPPAVETKPEPEVEPEAPKPQLFELSDRMAEVADDMVEKLIMDDGPAAAPPPANPSPVHPAAAPTTSELWYYRDPQSKVQGPFTATEMAEWYRAGYFDENLYVRRVCDGRFAALGELVKVCGNTMPFLASNLIPPLVEEPVPPPPVVPVVPVIADPVQLEYNMQALHKQFLMRTQATIYAKLATNAHFNMLTAEQQQHVVHQQMLQIAVPDYLANLAQPEVMPFNPLHQALKAAIKPPVVQPQPPPQQPPQPRQSLNMFLNAGEYAQPQHNMVMMQPPQPQPQEPIQHQGESAAEFLNRFQGHAMMPPNEWAHLQPRPQPQAPPQPPSQWHMPAPAVPPTPAPIVNMWDFGPINAKPKLEEPEPQHNDLFVEPKPVQQALPPQPMPAAPQAEPETEPEAEPVVVPEQPIKEEKQPTPVAKKNGKPKNGSASEKKKQLTEEERRREAAEEKKRQKEEKKRQQLEEEKKRLQKIEEERQRQLLEEKERQNEIDAHRRKAMMDSILVRNKTKQAQAQQQQQTSVAPWSSAAPAASTPGPSLVDIQKAERRERRAEEQRQLEISEKQTRAANDVREVALKWHTPPVPVKSLDEIQAEEAKRLASEQAAAADLQRRKEQEQALAATQNAGYTGNPFASIWNTRNAQNVAWNGSSASIVANAANQPPAKAAWGSTSNAGFWEEPVQTPAKGSQNGAQGNRALSKSQTVASIMPSAPAKANNGKAPVDKPAASNNDKNKKPKKEAAPAGSSGSSTSNNNGAKKDDFRGEFTNWCTKSLSSMNSKVDVPTFIAFLQDIESPYEVKDYIRMYLGESKEWAEFGKQFLERRSKYKNQQRAQNAHIDDMCQPAPAINPAGNDFMEVKGKAKKIKKGKMTKLDARILGFSVTAAQDRINVGDRDYGDAS